MPRDPSAMGPCPELQNRGDKSWVCGCQKEELLPVGGEEKDLSTEMGMPFIPRRHENVPGQPPAPSSHFLGPPRATWSFQTKLPGSNEERGFNQEPPPAWGVPWCQQGPAKCHCAECPSRLEPALSLCLELAAECSFSLSSPPPLPRLHILAGSLSLLCRCLDGSIQRVSLMPNS